MAGFIVSEIYLQPWTRWQIAEGTGPACKDVFTVDGFDYSDINIVWRREPVLSIPCAPVLSAFPHQGLGFVIKASFVFPESWRSVTGGAGAFKFRLRNQGLILESPPMALATFVNPRTPGETNIDISVLRLVTPAQESIQGPFRSDGNWSATLVCCSMTGNEVKPALLMVDPLPHPLEVFIFTGRSHDLFSETGHRIEIIRRSVMSIGAYSLLQQPVTRAAYEDRAIRIINEDVWSMGSGYNDFGHDTYVYDVERGRSFFGVGPYGGRLSLELMISQIFANCYDLAAVTQAWFASLGMRGQHRNAEPVISYCWVFSGHWFGYATEGPLMGWVNAGMPDLEDWRRCNSPFWYRPPVADVPWYHSTDLMNPNRKPFGNHAWTEVFTPGRTQLRVVENCHAALGNDVNDVRLAMGNMNRAMYYAIAVNQGLYTAYNAHNYQPLVYLQQPDGTFWVFVTRYRGWFINHHPWRRGLTGIDG